MFNTTIAGSLPKPFWLAEPQRLWPQWTQSGQALNDAKRDATLLWLKVQEDAGIDIVAKAHDWFARLSSGRRDSVGAIAREERVTSSYVTRVVHLAFLAPDIVQGILRGDHPPELNAERLIRIVPLPLAWDEQRALLAMTD